MATTLKTKVTELTHQIRNLDDPAVAVMQIMQNFEDVQGGLAAVQKYLNEKAYAVIENKSEFEEKAITYGLDADKPT